MSNAIPSVVIDVATGEDEVLRRKITQYEELLKGSLGPKARRMFEHAVARARTDLVALLESFADCCDLSEPARDPLQERAHDPDVRGIEENSAGGSKASNAVPSPISVD